MTKFEGNENLKYGYLKRTDQIFYSTEPTTHHCDWVRNIDFLRLPLLQFQIKTILASHSSLICAYDCILFLQIYCLMLCFILYLLVQSSCRHALLSPLIALYMLLSLQGWLQQVARRKESNNHLG